MKKRVCVDLDATLLYYTNWEDMGGRLGRARPGAKEFLESLRQHCDVVIFTARLSNDYRSTHALNAIRNHLDHYGLVYDEIYEGRGKPVCSAFVDDRAVEVPKNPVEVDFEEALVKVRRRLEDA